MQEYDFDIAHKSSHKHGNADALSKVPCKQLTEILKAKEAGTDTSPWTPQGQGMELKQLIQLWNQLRVKDGLCGESLKMSKVLLPPFS